MSDIWNLVDPQLIYTKVTSNEIANNQYNEQLDTVTQQVDEDFYANQSIIKKEEKRDIKSELTLIKELDKLKAQNKEKQSQLMALNIPHQDLDQETEEQDMFAQEQLTSRLQNQAGDLFKKINELKVTLGSTKRLIDEEDHTTEVILNMKVTGKKVQSSNQSKMMELKSMYNSVTRHNHDIQNTKHKSECGLNVVLSKIAKVEEEMIKHTEKSQLKIYERRWELKDHKRQVKAITNSLTRKIVAKNEKEHHREKLLGQLQDEVRDMKQTEVENKIAIKVVEGLHEQFKILHNSVVSWMEGEVFIEQVIGEQFVQQVCSQFEQMRYREHDLTTFFHDLTNQQYALNAQIESMIPKLKDLLAKQGHDPEIAVELLNRMKRVNNRRRSVLEIPTINQLEYEVKTVDTTEITETGSGGFKATRKLHEFLIELVLKLLKALIGARDITQGLSRNVQATVYEVGISSEKQKYGLFPKPKFGRVKMGLPPKFDSFNIDMPNAYDIKQPHLSVLGVGTNMHYYRRRTMNFAMVNQLKMGQGKQDKIHIGFDSYTPYTSDELCQIMQGQNVHKIRAQQLSKCICSVELIQVYLSQDDIIRNCSFFDEDIMVILDKLISDAFRNQKETMVERMDALVKLLKVAKEGTQEIKNAMMVTDKTTEQEIVYSTAVKRMQTKDIKGEIENDKVRKRLSKRVESLGQFKRPKAEDSTPQPIRKVSRKATKTFDVRPSNVSKKFKLFETDMWSETVRKHLAPTEFEILKEEEHDEFKAARLQKKNLWHFPHARSSSSITSYLPHLDQKQSSAAARRAQTKRKVLKECLKIEEGLKTIKEMERQADNKNKIKIKVPNHLKQLKTIKPMKDFQVGSLTARTKLKPLI